METIPEEIVSTIVSFADDCSCAALWWTSHLFRRPVGRRRPRRRNICEIIAKQGHIPLLRWAIEIGYRPHGDTLSLIAELGDLDMLNFAVLHDSSQVLGDYLEAAARGGHKNIIQWARMQGHTWNEDICPEAARGGHLELLQWLRRCGCPWDERVCEAAAENGHLRVLRWLRGIRHCGTVSSNTIISPPPSFTTQGPAMVIFIPQPEPCGIDDNAKCPWDSGTCAAAARSGHLEVLEWLRVNGCHWDFNTTFDASMNGHLVVLQYAVANYCPFNTIECCSTAIINGRFNIFKWIVENCGRVSTHLYSKVASHGTLEMLKLATSNGFILNENVYSIIAERGDLEMLRWLREHECPQDDTACLSAIGSGKIEVLEFVINNGCGWHPAAASCCNKEMYEWINANGFPWYDPNDAELPWYDSDHVNYPDDDYMDDDESAEYHSQHTNQSELSKAIEKLIPKRSNPQPTDPLSRAMAWWNQFGVIAPTLYQICHKAAFEGNIEVVRWCTELGHLWSESMCAAAALGGSLGLLQWLRNNDCPWDETTSSSAAANGSLRLLQWVLDNKCPFDENVCTEASRNGHLGVLSWAVKYGCPFNIEVCRQLAIEGQHELVIEWFKRDGYIAQPFY